eukprot:m.242372 g.242372  ORF g.242372 m.242372 type:complete len:354 (+) comp32836_c0_seq1:19-1080(+)
MKLISGGFAVVLLVLVECVVGDVPVVHLKNAATEGMTMPAIGLGTGGYGTNRSVGYNGYPECWVEIAGCGNNTVRAVKEWLRVGGRRIDSADSYYNEKSVGIAMRESGVPREDIFLLSKVGPTLPLGFQDALDQFEKIKSDMKVSYVDLLLIHWPTDTSLPLSKDPLCNYKESSYDPKGCRLSTWKALVQIFNNKGARAIGVSNYNSSHIQEIIDAGLPLPAANQCPFHLYRSSTQMDTVRFCQEHNITFIGYSPLGIPDYHKFPGPEMSPTTLEDDVVVAIASNVNKTPAQVVINWEWQHGIPVNPRSMNSTHMEENLSAYDFTLTQAHVDALSSRAQDTCKVDPGFYECAP